MHDDAQLPKPASTFGMTVQPLVYISVLNWHNPQEVAECIRALLDLDYNNYRIIVINNGSKADLMRCVAPWEDRIIIYHNGANLGFCQGNNIAIARALDDHADFIWLFNSDAVPEKNALSRLVSAMESDPRIGLASPVLYHNEPRSMVWNAGGWFDLRRCNWGWFVNVEEANQFQGASPEHFMLPGTALLVKASMVRRIGGLDEAFFAYHEDTDFSVRAERATFSRRLVTDANVYHNHAIGSTPSVHACYYNSRNETLVWRKYSPVVFAFRRRLWSFVTVLAAYRRNVGNSAIQGAYLTGWWHGQLGVRGERDSRRTIPTWLARFLTHLCFRKQSVNNGNP